MRHAATTFCDQASHVFIPLPSLSSPGGPVKQETNQSDFYFCSLAAPSLPSLLPRCRTWHFPLLNFLSFLSAHFYVSKTIWFITYCSQFVTICKHGTGTFSSIIQIFNEGVELCCLPWWPLRLVALITTPWTWSFIQFSVCLNLYLPILYFVSCLWWHYKRQSKPFLKSRCTKPMSLLFTNKLVTLLEMATRLVKHDVPFINPCWPLLMTTLPFRSWEMLSQRIFFITFLRWGTEVRFSSL